MGRVRNGGGEVTRTITRVHPNFSYLGRTPNGVSEGLTRAIIQSRGPVYHAHAEMLDGDREPFDLDTMLNEAEAQAAATYFRKQYDSDMQDGLADVWETAPLGRENDENGQWRWPTRSEFEGPIMAGFKAFLDARPVGTGKQVRASFGCPRHLTYRGFRLDMNRMPVCDVQFDDVSSRAPKLTKRLMKYGRTWQNVVLETALTDSPTEPRRATRFVTFPGYENVVQRVRAGIVGHWYTRDCNGDIHTPIGGWPNKSLRLSLFLPATDCETMTADTLRRVLPLFVDVSLQGAIPDAHMRVVREWRSANV